MLGRPSSRSDGKQIRDSWDRRWGDDTYQPRFELNDSDPSVRRAVEDGWFSQGARALDIGCGAGHNAAWLAEQGFETVGVDFSRQAVERASAVFEDTPRLTFEVVDVTLTDVYPETFDVLVDRGCLHGIRHKDRTAYASNLESWGRTGSRLLLIVRKKDRRDDQVVARARKVLEPGFSFVSGRSVDLAGPYAEEPLPAMSMRFARTV